MHRVEVGYGPGELINRKKVAYAPPAKLVASMPEYDVVYSSYTPIEKKQKTSEPPQTPPVD